MDTTRTVPDVADFAKTALSAPAPMASAEADSYGSRAFWDARYEDSASTLFDWYQDYEALAQLLLPLLRPTSRVLHLGCGNSRLPEALYDAGFKDVTSVDYSAPAVEHMRRRNAAARPELRFEVADARSLAIAPAAYDLVLDKGLLDAMLCSGENAAAGVAAMVAAVRGALAPGGAYACVSYGAPRDRLRWLRGGVADWAATDVWSLPKPSAADDDGAAPTATRQRDGDAEPAEGSAHFVYLLTAPGEAAPQQQRQAPAEAAPVGESGAAGADATGGAARWAF